MALNVNQYTIIFSIYMLIIIKMICKSTYSIQIRAHFYSNNTMFTNNSRYEANHNTLFVDLSSNATNPNGYHQAVASSNEPTYIRTLPLPWRSEHELVSRLFFVTIYGLGQCTQNLSSSDCSTYLVNVVGMFKSTQGGRILQPSCVIWYEVYPFFNFSSLPPPPSQPPTSTANLTHSN
ncbi:putative cysteine-rich repeat secretory protein 10, partial [Bienertia sinuspersici]